MIIIRQFSAFCKEESCMPTIRAGTFGDGANSVTTDTLEGLAETETCIADYSESKHVLRESSS